MHSAKASEPLEPVDQDVVAFGGPVVIDAVRHADISPEPGLLAGLPLAFLGKRRLLPLRLRGERVEVAAADPIREEDLHFLGHYYRHPVEPRLASAKEILFALAVVAKRHGDSVPDRRQDPRPPPRPPRHCFYESPPRSGHVATGARLAVAVLVLWAVVSNRLVFAWVKRQRASALVVRQGERIVELSMGQKL